MTTAFAHLVRTTKPISVKMIAEGKVGARLATYENGVRAVMKPSEAVSAKRGKAAPHGIPVVSIPRREAAFYNLSKLLGYTDLVSETVLAVWEGIPVSFQLFVNAAKLYELDTRLKNPESEDKWTVAFRETMRHFPTTDVLRLTLMDFIACSRDRHGGNYGARLDKDMNWRLAGWDNGESFGDYQTRYHCVAHKYYYANTFPVDAEIPMLARLDHGDVAAALDMLSPTQIDHVWYRIQFVLEYPQRLPWSVLSQGAEGPKDFPSYEEHFKPVSRDSAVARTRYVLRQGQVSG